MRCIEYALKTTTHRYKMSSTLGLQYQSVSVCLRPQNIFYFSVTLNFDVLAPKSDAFIYICPQIHQFCKFGTRKSV